MSPQTRTVGSSVPSTPTVCYSDTRVPTDFVASLSGLDPTPTLKNSYCPTDSVNNTLDYDNTHLSTGRRILRKILVNTPGTKHAKARRRERSLEKLEILERLEKLEKLKKRLEEFREMRLKPVYIRGGCKRNEQAKIEDEEKDLTDGSADFGLTPRDSSSTIPSLIWSGQDSSMRSLSPRLPNSDWHTTTPWWAKKRATPESQPTGPSELRELTQSHLSSTSCNSRSNRQAKTTTGSKPHSQSHYSPNAHLQNSTKSCPKLPIPARYSTSNAPPKMTSFTSDEKQTHGKTPREICTSTAPPSSLIPLNMDLTLQAPPWPKGNAPVAANHRRLSRLEKKRTVSNPSKTMPPFHSAQVPSLEPRDTRSTSPAEKSKRISPFGSLVSLPKHYPQGNSAPLAFLRTGISCSSSPSAFPNAAPVTPMTNSLRSPPRSKTPHNPTARPTHQPSQPHGSSLEKHSAPVSNNPKAKITSPLIPNLSNSYSNSPSSNLPPHSSPLSHWQHVRPLTYTKHSTTTAAASHRTRRIMKRLPSHIPRPEHSGRLSPPRRYRPAASRR